MNFIQKLVDKHPVATIFIVSYTLLCLNYLKAAPETRPKYELDRLQGIHPPLESPGYSGLLILICGISFIINSCYAIGSKTKPTFYVCLIFIVIAETIAVLNIG